MLNNELALFVRQLNQCLQTTDRAAWAGSVCGLYRSHTGAGVKLTLRNGDTEAEALPQTEGEDILTLRVCQNETQLGTLTITGALDENDRTAAGVLQALFTITLRQSLEQSQTDRRRRLDAVRAVINTLSFSELEAAVHISQSLKGGEGLIVAARMADELKITRSVVVNALRKLEGAGMVESRSLGMKGTHIKFKDEMLTAELGKL